MREIQITIPSDLWSDGDLYQGVSLALSKALRAAVDIDPLSKRTIKTFPDPEITISPIGTKHR
ncbi:MAG: hypothetical protein Roseis2KO_49740 [Roseivirga sp.]